MSGLFRLLNLGANTLQAHNAGVANASHNTANVNTEGYSRQRVDLNARRISSVLGGVVASGPGRMTDPLLAGRIRANSSSFGFGAARSSALSSLESTLSAEGNDITAALADLFGQFNEMAQAPKDLTLRASGLESASRLASTIRRHASEISHAQNDSNERIAGYAEKVNSHAKEIARINKMMKAADDPNLLDKRDLFAKEIAELVGGKAIIDSSGQMRFILDNGATLVDGINFSTLEVTPDVALNNFYKVEMVHGSIRHEMTAAIEGGKIGGELRFRDTDSTTAMTSLDNLAFDISTQFNTTHATSFDLSGAAGGDFFAPPGAVAGAAQSFDVDTALTAEKIALSNSATAPGNNAGALAIVAHRDDPTLAGGGARTFIDESIHILAEVGNISFSVSADLDFYTAQKDSLDALRDSLSGVSIQEELANLTQFQRASEATAKFISTVDDLLGNLIQIL